MASVSNDLKTGRRRIQFFGIDGKRQAIRLGKVSKNIAANIATRVDAIVGAQTAGLPIDRETATWISDELSSKLRGRFVSVGLLPSTDEKSTTTVDAFLTRHIASLKRKPATIEHLQLARRNLVDFFGADRDLTTIKAGEADNFRRHLEQTMNAKSTVPRICGRAKQFFRAAKREGLIEIDPFADMRGTTVKANEDRQFFITEEVADAVLKACPTVRCQMIFALARYGGLRCCSEVVLLKWSDINWKEGTFLVHSPKTEHHEGKSVRIVPLFPRLRVYLEAGLKQAKGEYVIEVKNRASRNNFGPQIDRIVTRAGFEPWEKTFVNLRSSLETELLDQGHSLKAVCKWLGNSPAVAMKHYAQVRKEDYRRAAGMPDEKAAQKAAHQPATTDHNGTQQKNEPLKSLGKFEGLCSADGCEGALSPLYSSRSRGDKPRKFDYTW
jgi:integrase